MTGPSVPRVLPTAPIDKAHRAEGAGPDPVAYCTSDAGNRNAMARVDSARFARGQHGVSIVIHSLESSRSIRVAWLLEELGLPYEVKLYTRDENLRAPPELASVHPLGRSPVVEVDGHVLAESGAILEYFVEREDRLRPASAEERIEYRFFLHYAEGSMMPPLLVHLIMRKLRERPLPFFVKPIARKIAEGIQSAFSTPAIALHMGFADRALEKRPYFAGQSFSAADVQMYYPIATALMRVDGDWPNLVAWKDRVSQRDAFARATQKTGELVAFS